MTKKNIGFLSFWGWGRGMCFVTMMYAKMLKDDFNVFIYKQKDNLIQDDFAVDYVHVTDTKKHFPTGNEFKDWIKTNKIDAVVFNEYKQWEIDSDNLVRVAREAGCRVYGYLVLERFGIPLAEMYDRILAPSVSYEKYLRQSKIRNFTYVPYSLDLNEFPKEMKVKRSEKFTFFHPGGWGGVHQRKNTESICHAFGNLKVDNIKLVITSQAKFSGQTKQWLASFKNEVEVINKNLTRTEIIEQFYKADVVVLPSKWETIGIPILEALGAGKPVITSNAPPMNEFIVPNMNGFVVDGSMLDYEGIAIKGIDVDIRKLEIAMETSMIPDINAVLKKNARHVAEELYDLEKNKKYFINFLNEDLK